ncbi:MAG: hypothetical protein U1F35_14175, partial [Steroidobacteraceae bacterium]
CQVRGLQRSKLARPVATSEPQIAGISERLRRPAASYAPVITPSIASLGRSSFKRNVRSPAAIPSS